MIFQTTLRALTLLVCFASGTIAAQSQLSIEELRQLFLDGQSATSRNRLSDARQIHQQLVAADYVLAPYLEMSLMIADANRLSVADLEAFMDRYPGTWLAEKLRLNYLNTLRSRRDYSNYVKLFIPGTGNSIQQCFYLEALHRTGDVAAAWEGARDMWLVGKSQPDQCDYIFSRWRRDASFSEEYIWQRYILARRADQRSLSDYLANQIKDDNMELRLKAYNSIRSSPEILRETDAFIGGGQGYSAIVAQGLVNLADRDLDLTLQLWPVYRDAGILTDADLKYLLDDLVPTLLARKGAAGALQFAADNRTLISQAQFEKCAVASLAAKDWQAVLDWIDLMSPEQAESNQWLYWRARSMNQIGIAAGELYDRVRFERSYYSLLASILNEQPFTLAELAPNPSAAQEIPPALLQAWQRAAELEKVAYYNNSRLTWQHANDELDVDTLLAASEWAAGERHFYLSIRATIDAEVWDRLDVRFPIAYLTAYQQASLESGIPLPWLYGLSRQESSFAPDIQSPAGATGLMQLMPATAREAARRLGVRFDDDLRTQPDYNVRLGANFLQSAYSQLDNNPIYTSAAYNAGVSRVKSWLTGTKAQLPLDVWVETIPFTETRNYVKNVMAFSVIYAAKLGQTSPLQQMDESIFLPGGRAAP